MEMPASLIQVPAIQLWLDSQGQFPAGAHPVGSGNGTSSWVPVTHRGDRVIPGFGLSLDPVPAVAGI